MSQIIWHMCFISVQQCAPFKMHLVKTGECFANLETDWLIYCDCVTVATLQESFWKIENGLQNVRGVLWKWWMFCTWDTPRGRGSACVSQGATVVKSSFCRVSKKAEQSTLHSKRVSQSAKKFGPQGFPLTSILFLPSRLKNNTLFVLTSYLWAFFFGCVLNLGAFFLWLS